MANMICSGRGLTATGSSKEEFEFADHHSSDFAMGVE